MNYYLGNIGGHIAVVHEDNVPISNQYSLIIESECHKPTYIRMKRYSDPKTINEKGDDGVKEIWEFKQVNFDPIKDVNIMAMEFELCKKWISK